MLVPLLLGSLVGTFRTGSPGDRKLHHRAVRGPRLGARRDAQLRHRDPIAAADPSCAPFVVIATAQVAAAIHETAILAPVAAAAVLERESRLSPVHVKA